MPPSSFCPFTASAEVPQTFQQWKAHWPIQRSAEASRKNIFPAIWTSRGGLQKGLLFNLPGNRSSYILKFRTPWKFPLIVDRRGLQHCFTMLIQTHMDRLKRHQPTTLKTTHASQCYCMSILDSCYLGVGVTRQKITTIMTCSIYSKIHPSLPPPIHKCMHACMHECTHAHTHTHAHPHTQARTHAHMHACTHTHTPSLKQWVSIAQSHINSCFHHLTPFSRVSLSPNPLRQQVSISPFHKIYHPTPVDSLPQLPCLIRVVCPNHQTL